jgi:arylformamidase
MKIYDISQEVFNCNVFPGDPQPEKISVLKINEGAVCNLTAIKMCAHNGTHVDAPYHFIDSGKKIDEVSMERFVGFAYVTEFEGNITGDDARKMVEKANKAFAEENAPCIKVETPDKCRRILVKGKAVVTEEAAKVFVESNLLLFGNESQTVGPEDAPMAVHLIMLGAEIVLLEGIRLADVEEGIYLLDAAPINLGGADGAPCRAILMQL